MTLVCHFCYFKAENGFAMNQHMKQHFQGHRDPFVQRTRKESKAEVPGENQNPNSNSNNNKEGLRV